MHQLLGMATSKLSRRCSRSSQSTNQSWAWSPECSLLLSKVRSKRSIVSPLTLKTRLALSYHAERPWWNATELSQLSCMSLKCSLSQHVFITLSLAQMTKVHRLRNLSPYREFTLARSNKGAKCSSSVPITLTRSQTWPRLRFLSYSSWWDNLWSL